MVAAKQASGCAVAGCRRETPLPGLDSAGRDRPASRREQHLRAAAGSGLLVRGRELLVVSAIVPAPETEGHAMPVDLRMSPKDGPSMNPRPAGAPATRSTSQTAAIPPEPMINPSEFDQGGAL